MEKIISPYKAAYVSGRLISDNTVIAQEIIHSMKKKRGQIVWMGLKLDMSKAFERLEWSFLLKVLNYFGFSDDLCDLIHQCISTSTLSVLLNGSPSDEFKPTRGIRQGDPLSPYLFILAMEFLSRHLVAAQQHKTIQGIKENLTSVNNLPNLLNNFSTQSGQVINFEKSAVHFSKHTKPEVVDCLTNILGVKTMNSKENYLGSPLILGHSKQEAFKSVQESFEQRLSTYNSISLTQAGSSTMIKHVLNAVPTYQMGTFKLPNQLINKLTTIERHFFWVHKSNKDANPIAWLKICKSRDFGGLTFRDLEKLNLDLLTKMAWRICTESSNLMMQLTRKKYFRNGDILHQKIEAKNCSYSWNGIAIGMIIVQQNYFIEINNDRETKIWLDIWIPGMTSPPVPINELFRFYADVVELIIPGKNNWNITLLDQLFDNNTSARIQSMFLDVTKEDKMIWMPSKDGKFSVKSTYNKLTSWDGEVNVNGRIIQSVVWKALWKSGATHRVKLFIWKCIREINQTREKLEVYNIEQETQCGSCGTGACIGIKGSFTHGTLNPEEGECMAIRETLAWAKKKSYFKIQIEAYGKLVIQSLTGTTSLIQWENRNILKEIKHLSLCFSFCSFSFISRDHNQVADELAKSVRTSELDVELYDSFNANICSLLVKDIRNFDQ
ncbi:uncharacterized protein LOC113305335 [Papaver somniferum]|uniref:uncharacterized protein LOC113305335 n=1 Tax=Papaver somniferum TaxID=3469 RepID=UPI000E6F7705|nr:uncharacterized protein LOC113305335 [Papaver somniferum]